MIHSKICSYCGAEHGLAVNVLPDFIGPLTPTVWFGCPGARPVDELCSETFDQRDLEDPSLFDPGYWDVLQMHAMVMVDNPSKRIALSNSARGVEVKRMTKFG